MPVNRGSTSRGAHVRALWEALSVLIEDVADVPSEKRVRLRTLRSSLERAHPELKDEVSIAHFQEDEP